MKKLETVCYSFEGEICRYLMYESFNLMLRDQVFNTTPVKRIFCYIRDVYCCKRLANQQLDSCDFMCCVNTRKCGSV